MRLSGICIMIIVFSFSGYTGEVKEGHDPVPTILQIDSLNHLADICRWYDMDKAKKYGEEALSASRHLHYLKGQADALCCLSSYLFQVEEYTKSFEFQYEALELYIRLKDYKMIVDRYAHLGNFFLAIKNKELADKYFNLMVSAGSKIADPRSQGILYSGSAQYEIEKKNYRKAIRYLYCSIYFLHEAGEKYREGIAYKYLGDAYSGIARSFQAESAYRTAIACLNKIDTDTLRMNSEKAIIYTRLAHFYQTLEMNQKNLEYNLTAMRLREAVGRKDFITSSYLNVGESYWLLGQKDSANHYLDKALKLGLQIRSNYLLEAIYTQLSDFAYAEKRYQDALNFYTLRIGYQNKLTYEQQHSEIAILDANKNIRANEAQNDLIRQENLIQNLHIRNRRIQTFLLEIAFLALMSVIIFIDVLVSNNKKRKNELTILNDRLQNEIHEHAEAAIRLDRSEKLHRFIAEHTADVISLLDTSLKRLYISPSCEKVYGYRQEEILQMNGPLDLVDPSYRVMVNQRFLEMYRTKKTIRYGFKAIRKNGSVFWAEANINPVTDPATGDVKDLITVVRDISERKHHEEEIAENARQKEFLLREIHNRVKNNFSILTSLMDMHRVHAGDSDLNYALSDLQLRVRTMSLVHEQLYQTQEISTIPFDNYLQNLTAIISNSFNNNRITLLTDIRPCQLPIEMALPMGLIINELITNVYKYAFPGDCTGNLWVSLLPEDREKYCICIRDNGIGLPGDFTVRTTHSTGTQIVRILIQQIEATLEIASNGGACFRILFSPGQE